MSKRRIKRRLKRNQLSNWKKFLVFGCSFVITMFMGVMFLLYGPMPKFRNWLVTTAMTTMNHKYLATWFYSDEEIERILDQNKVIQPDKNTDTSLINTLQEEKVYKDEYEREILEHEDGELYKMIEISGDNYSGFLVAIYDPSKIKLVTTENLGYSGEYLVDMARKSNAVVAINGGGFVDDTTLKSGGVPNGIVIKNGEILSYRRFRRLGGLIGFTNDNKLFLGSVTADEALNLGVRDAVEFGPFLIVNGEASKVVGNGGYGLHPRTVIGQRQDGVVLFLVIDGRRIGCMGADMDELIKIMQRYGAYNAANLDGGNSSALVINNKLINHPINWDKMEATRPIATGFVLVDDKLHN